MTLPEKERARNTCFFRSSGTLTNESLKNSLEEKAKSLHGERSWSKSNARFMPKVYLNIGKKSIQWTKLLFPVVFYIESGLYLQQILAFRMLTVVLRTEKYGMSFILTFSHSKEWNTLKSISLHDVIHLFLLPFENFFTFFIRSKWKVLLNFRYFLLTSFKN